MSGYVFAESDLVAEQQECMQQALDPITTARLEALGVAPGWRCLEVGGGGGSIASWLGERVGDAGHVLVTDIRPDRLARHSAPNVTVREHDIVADELPEAAFDLVHARLVLLHLPERRRALARMVRALRPGDGCSSVSSTAPGCRCCPHPTTRRRTSSAVSTPACASC